MSQLAVSPDLVTVITNVGVFLAASGTVIAAIWQAVKKIKTVMPETPAGSRVMSGMIMENQTLLMWSESNRSVVEKMSDLEKEIMELRFAMTQLREKL